VREAVAAARRTGIADRRIAAGPEILVAEEPFETGDRGIVESIGQLVVTIRVERAPTRLRTLIGANLKGQLLIID